MKRVFLLSIAASVASFVVSASPANAQPDLRANEPKPRLAVGHGHGDPIRTLAFTSDGKRLISAGEDGFIFIWDPTKTEPIATLRVDKRHIYSVAISPDD